MIDWKADPRMREMFKLFNSEGHEFLLDKKRGLKKGELSLEQGLRTEGGAQSEMVSVALKDLSGFFEKSFRIRPRSGQGVPLRLETDPSLAGKRDHRLEITKDGVVVAASGEWGFARGLYRLQSMLKTRRFPALPRRVVNSDKSLAIALAHPMFKSNSEVDLSHPEAYERNYLLRLARAGYTGFHINLKMRMFHKSSILPELDDADADGNLETLRKIVDEARSCSLEVFLSLYQELYDVDSPVFKRLPNIRGSRLFSSESLASLCGSNQTVRAFHREQFERLFSLVPGLGGALLISGCEGWLHCHTACARDSRGRCDCEACASTSPEKSVAEMMNNIARAIKNASPESRCVVWNYGIFAWTDPRAEKFISHLSPDCEVMSNFDTGDDFARGGVKGTYFDYSLSCVGPSSVFSAQKDAATRRGLKMLAKCESGSPLEFCSVQYVPALTRWSRKYSNIRKSGAAGALFNWKFMGYSESPAGELAGLMSFGEPDNILEKLAARDFGQENVPVVMEIWRRFDRGMDHHPFSIGTAGYFKGPLYIGFAHPLILDLLEVAGLPEEFRWRKSSLVTPDLSFVRPFGVKECLAAFRRQEKEWAKAVTLLGDIKADPSDQWSSARTAEHDALCRAMLCMLRTAINMTEFYEARDFMHHNPCGVGTTREKVGMLLDIARRELANAREGYEAIKRNHKIFFSYCYRYGVSETMCEHKIRHTEELISKRLPIFCYAEMFSRHRLPQFR